MRLQGEVADWESIVDRVARLRLLSKDVSFAAWTEKLAGVAEQLLRSKRGDVDLAFWERVVTRERVGSGSQTCIGGWVSAFMHFGDGGEVRGKSVSLPSNIAVVNFTLTAEEGKEEEQALSVVAGVMGVQQAGEGGAVKPGFDWAICPVIKAAEDPNPVLTALLGSYARPR